MTKPRKQVSKQSHDENQNLRKLQNQIMQLKTHISRYKPYIAESIRYAQTVKCSQKERDQVYKQIESTEYILRLLENGLAAKEAEFHEATAALSRHDIARLALEENIEVLKQKIAVNHKILATETDYCIQVFGTQIEMVPTARIVRETNQLTSELKNLQAQLAQLPSVSEQETMENHQDSINPNQLS